MTQPWPHELGMLKKVRRQCQIEHWLAGLLIAGGAALFAVALSTLLTALLPLLSPWRWLVALLAAGVALLLTWHRLPDDLAIARRLDRDLKSQERVQTLLENRAEEGTLLQELRRETQAYFFSQPPEYKRNIKRFIPPALFTGAAAVLLVLSIVFTPRLAQSLTLSRQLKEEQEQAVAAIEEVIQALPQDELTADLAAALEKLKEQIPQLKEAREFETFSREVQELLAAGEEQAAAVESALAELLAAMEMSAEELAQALEDPEFAQELAEALGDLAQALPQTASLAATLRRLAEVPGTVGAGQWQGLKEQLAGLDPAGLRESLANAVGKTGKETAAGSPGSTGVEGGESSEGSEGGEGGEGKGEPPGGNSGQGGQGQGQGSGQGPGQGSGQGQGTGSQGSGAGTGSTAPSPSRYVYIPGQGEFTLGGQGEAGEYTLRDLLPNQPGLVDDYADFFAGYRRQALSKLGGSQIPRLLADYVRSYFQAIAP